MQPKSLWDKNRPKPDEYAPFYQKYIDKLGSGNIIDILLNQMQVTYSLINSLDDIQALYRYDVEKWSVKQVFGHLLDNERIFSYRALCFSRGEIARLPGYDQEEYVKAGSFNKRSLESLGNEYYSLRNANVHLFRSFTVEMMARKGTASGNIMSVRSIPFIIAGHEKHHLDLLKTRYGITFPSNELK